MQESSYGFSNSSFELIKARKYDTALKFALLAKKADPNNTILYTNLALAYLLTNDWENAKNIYTTWKDSIYDDKTTKEGFLEDINVLSKKGITHPDFEKIRKLLKEEN